jgi:hypothetical protein
MPKDILLNDDDLLFINGDLVVRDSTLQHQKHLLLVQPGELREFPTVGVGLVNFLNDDALDDLGAAIQREFENDGMIVKKLDVYENGKLEIDASYEDQGN